MINESAINAIPIQDTITPIGLTKESKMPIMRIIIPMTMNHFSVDLV
jgi:hypothetical protein